MNARISSICLMNNGDGLYWKITLQDELGNVIGIFGDEIYSDDINFRKQTFYMMKILNNWDLLKLDGQKKAFPILVDNEFFRISCIANSDGEYLKFDYETGDILSGFDCDVSQFIPKEISSLNSTGGVLMSSITDKYSHRVVSCDMSYLGFSELYPNHENKEWEIRGAYYFKKFISSILKLCNIKELIQSDNYPEVSVKLNSNGDIIAIGDIDENEYFYITENGYELINGERKKR